MAIYNWLLLFLLKNTLIEFFDTMTHEVNLCHNSENNTECLFFEKL